MSFLLEEYMGNTPHVRLLQYFIEGRDFDYTLTDMLNAGVSWGTLNQMVPKFVHLELIVKTRKIGRATLYKLNQKNEAVKHFMAIYDKVILGKLESMQKKVVVAA